MVVCAVVWVIKPHGTSNWSLINKICYNLKKICSTPSRDGKYVMDLQRGEKTYYDVFLRFSSSSYQRPTGAGGDETVRVVGICKELRRKLQGLHPTVDDSTDESGIEDLDDEARYRDSQRAASRPEDQLAESMGLETPSATAVGGQAAAQLLHTGRAQDDFVAASLLPAQQPRKNARGGNSSTPKRGAVSGASRNFARKSAKRSRTQAFVSETDSATETLATASLARAKYDQDQLEFEKRKFQLEIEERRAEREERTQALESRERNNEADRDLRERQFAAGQKQFEVTFAASQQAQQQSHELRIAQLNSDQQKVSIQLAQLQNDISKHNKE
jgi:hypothetical protein